MKTPAASLTSLLNRLLKEDLFLSAVFHGPKSSTDKKITCRKLLIKGKAQIQCSFFGKQQVVHQNFSYDVFERHFLEFLSRFKKGDIFSHEANYSYLINKKGGISFLKHPATLSKGQEDHNRQKKTKIKEGEKVPYLMELGVISKEGTVLAGMRDKFLQINQLLDHLALVAPHLPSDRPVKVIDFGCGKGILTFAIYDYLTRVLKKQANIVGIDKKETLMRSANQLAKKLGFLHLSFLAKEILTHEEEEIDLMVALHLCDTATDLALKKALNWNAKVILAAPCCQNEAYHQISSHPLHAILKHGSLKERFAALATDALRASYLEAFGFTVSVFEFIDGAHTPKNLMIKAIRKGPFAFDEKKLESFRSLSSLLNLNLSLEKP